MHFYYHYCFCWRYLFAFLLFAIYELIIVNFVKCNTAVYIFTRFSVFFFFFFLILLLSISHVEKNIHNLSSFWPKHGKINSNIDWNMTSLPIPDFIGSVKVWFFSSSWHKNYEPFYGWPYILGRDCKHATLHLEFECVTDSLVIYPWGKYSLSFRNNLNIFKQQFLCKSDRQTLQTSGLWSGFSG